MGGLFFQELAQVSLAHFETKKPRFIVVFGLVGGERGIRTPGPVTVNSFQDYRNRPLCHLSAANVG